LRTRIDDLEGWLDAVGATKDVTLVVHDWGGMIGLGAAVRRPERIARVVLLNTAAFHLPKTKALPGRLRLARDTSLGALLVERFNAFSRGAAFFGVKRPLAPDVARALTAPYDTPANRIATLRFVQDIPLGPGDAAWSIVEETGRQLHRLEGKPMLLAWGLRDFVFDRAFYDEFVRRFPRAAAHAFEDAGHYVLEDAHERIVPLAREFLARHPV
jgi:haloalkane dehalogenase